MSTQIEILRKNLASCSYYPEKKNSLFNEISRLLTSYPSFTSKVKNIRVILSYSFLLELSGTIPVIYKQSSYNIPITIQYPLDYPKVPPILKVIPATDMVIKSSQYVNEAGDVHLSIFGA